MHWEIIYFDADVQQAVLVLPPGIAARYIHLTERMIEFGPNLGMPHTRAMGEGLFELRMKSKEGIGRAFFCLLGGNRIMILHAFVKKTTKTPVHELRLALARMKKARSNVDS